jgi:hypothetical protein
VDRIGKGDGFMPVKVEHPTFNIELRTSIACPEHADWMFDVRCWLLGVGCSL